MYESKHHSLLSRKDFTIRMSKHLLAVLLIIGLSIFLGMLGYWHFEGHSWSDAFMHTCFLLGGYGHLTLPKNTSGLVFLGFYGLYANLVFIAVLGVLSTPVIHRLLHAFHLEQNNDESTHDVP